MDSNEFYDYIIENFNLGGTASRLVSNIIEYIRDQEFIDAEDAQAHLKYLLDGAFGIEEREIKLYRAVQCEECGEYTPYPTDLSGRVLCYDCEAAWDLSDDEN